ncbi:MAG: hypothetical protein FWB97_11210 [Oscillospiraceae bacterium]|nr:hypothetical protein [Oscillospiraceae bacterium]
MSTQTKSCFKKEVLAFSRTKKLLILVCIVIGWAILGPLMIRGLGLVMDTLAPIYDEFGMDVAGMTEMIAANVSLGVVSAISDLTTVGLIAFLLLINSFAGGEQKKRSIMIPKSAGLRSFPYLFPKYIVYPLTALALAIVAAFVAWGVSAMAFEVNDVAAGGVLLGGALAGVSLMFYICIHLTLGTATGKAGMSAAVCIIASLLLPNMFALLGSELIYNPFTLNVIAGTVVPGGAVSAFLVQEIAMTVLIVLAIIVALFFIALFVQNAKKIDNSGNEVRL